MKSSFVNGDILTPTYMNTIYGTGVAGGHKHDGVDADGHAVQIDLTTDVTGILPSVNMDVRLRNYIDGFTMSWNVATNQWSISIAPGYAIDSSNTYSMSLTSALTKTITNVAGTTYDPWVSGDSLGGVSAQPGVTPIADQVWLHAFVAVPVVSGVVVPGVIDVGFDSSVTAANILLDMAAGSAYSNWVYRRIGSIKIKFLGAAKYGIDKFTQQGDYFSWLTNQSVYNSTVATTPSVTTITASYATPPGVNTLLQMQSYLAYAASGNTVHLWDGTLGATATGGGAILYVPTLSGAASSDHLDIIAANQTIYATKTSAANSPTLVLNAVRYKDFRGRS